MIGTLVKFSPEKRELYFPNQPQYPDWHNRNGLVTRFTTDYERGTESARVHWLKPFERTDYKGEGTPLVTFSDFNFLNFEVIGEVKNECG